MKSIDIIVNNYLQTQGVNSVVDQFLLNRNCFFNLGVNINCVYDCKNKYYNIPTRVSSPASRKASIKSKIKRSKVYSNKFTESSILYFKVRQMGVDAANVFLNDATHSNCVLVQDVFAAYVILKKDPKINVIYMTHMYDDEYEQLIINYPHTNNSLIKQYFLDVHNYVYTHASQIVVICRNAKNSLCRKHPEIKKKVRIVYNAIEDPQICAKPGNNETIRFVSASSLNSRKGTDLLMEFLMNQTDYIKNNTEYHIFGYGDLYPQLVKTKDTYNIDNLFLYGRVTNPVTNYSNKDVYLLTSRDECLPMSIIEAMSAGMPILATNVGAVAEMIQDKNNGWLISPTVSHIKNGVENVIDMKNSLQEMGSISRRIYDKNFSSERWVKQFVEIFLS